MRTKIFIFLLIAAFALVGCRATAEPTLDGLGIVVEVFPAPPAVGEANVHVTLTDKDNDPISDATVKITGNMSHAGMVPVIAESNAGTDGLYEIPFEWTMGGDWVLTVEVTLADGESTSQEFEFNGVEDTMDMEATEEATEEVSDMGGMDMEATEEATEEVSDMGGMDMGMGEGMSSVSPAYMAITNNSDTDITLLSISAEGIGIAEIHQETTENNPMQMEHMADGLLIPAGETVELSRSGYHVVVVFMQFENDLVTGDTIHATLNFDNDTAITLDIPVASESPEDGLEVEENGLTISGAWAHPTMDMGDMDMGGMGMAGHDMSGMGGMDMHMSEGVTSVSGAYMAVTNNSDADITLLSISAEGIGMAEIHQTIVENNIMRMEHMADGLLIPAGETVELSPGGYHVMLMQLENELIAGDTIHATLNFDNETAITLDVPVASESPEDGAAVEENGLTISGAWARPTMLAEASDMGGMDMEATEEASGD